MSIMRHLLILMTVFAVLMHTNADRPEDHNNSQYSTSISKLTSNKDEINSKDGPEDHNNSQHSTSITKLTPSKDEIGSKGQNKSPRPGFSSLIIILISIGLFVLVIVVISVVSIVFHVNKGSKKKRKPNNLWSLARMPKTTRRSKDEGSLTLSLDPSSFFRDDTPNLMQDKIEPSATNKNPEKMPEQTLQSGESQQNDTQK